MRSWTFLATGLTIALGACATGQSAGDDDQPIDGRPGDIDAEPHHVPDAQQINPIDAREGTPDAAVAAPDAAVAPDANVQCTPVTQQRLANGNFDSTPLGIGWTQLPQDPTYPPIVTPTDLSAVGLTAQSGANAVWLGGALSSTDALYQQITLPADATSLQIYFYKRFASEETAGTYDYLRVQIRSTADAVLETVATFGNPTTTTSDTAWVPIGPLSVSGNYAGQTIRLYFQSQTDSLDNTNFFLDTTSLTVLACP